MEGWFADDKFEALDREIQMPFGYRVSPVLSTDETRPTITQAKLMMADGDWFIVGTDSYCGVAVRVTRLVGKDVREGRIPTKALAHLESMKPQGGSNRMQGAGLKQDPEDPDRWHWVEKTGIEMSARSIYGARSQDPYPNVREAISGLFEQPKGEEPGGPYIGMSATLLATALKAFTGKKGYPPVMVFTSAPMKPMVVWSRDEDCRMAAMPMRTDSAWDTRRE